MIPLLVLIAVTLISRCLGVWRIGVLRNWPAALRIGLAVMFCFTGMTHFSDLRDDFIRMVPPLIPFPGEMVVVAGVCEIVGGIGLLIPRVSRFAAYALIVFLIAVFPANIYGSMSGVTLGGDPLTPLWLRTGIQMIFILLLWWSGVRNNLNNMDRQ